MTATILLTTPAGPQIQTRILGFQVSHLLLGTLDGVVGLLS